MHHPDRPPLRADGPDRVDVEPSGHDAAHAHGRRHRHAHPRKDLVSTGARRRFRALPWRGLARISGAVLLALTAWLAPVGLLIAATALAFALVVERLLHRPIPLERDRSRRHLRRNLAVGLTTAVAVGLYAFAVGDPTSHLRPARGASYSDEEDRAARNIVALGGATALGTLGLSFLLFGFDRSAERHARRRRAGRGRDAAAPA